jgi:hypothetical protein
MFRAKTFVLLDAGTQLFVEARPVADTGEPSGLRSAI